MGTPAPRRPLNPIPASLRLLRAPPHTAATLYATHDGWQNWTEVANAPTGRAGCGRPIVDALDATDVFITVDGLAPTPGSYDLWRSRDGGASWRKLTRPNTTDSTIPTGLAVVDGRIILSIERDGEGTIPRKLFGSDDGGVSWRPLGQGIIAAGYVNLGELSAAGALLYERADNSTCFGGCIGNAPPFENSYWRSHDGGDTWVQAAIPGNLDTFTRSASGDAYYGLSEVWQSATGQNALYWSGDSGATWNAVPSLASAAGGILDPSFAGTKTITPDGAIVTMTFLRAANPNTGQGAPAGIFRYRANDAAPCWRPLAGSDATLWQIIPTAAGARLWGIHGDELTDGRLVYLDIP